MDQQTYERTNGHNVSGEKLVGLQSIPLVVSETLDWVRSHCHRSELGESPQALGSVVSQVRVDKLYCTHLPHDRAFKYNKHEQSEQAVVPILVQAPKSYAEHLKHEERGSRVLRKELCERRNGYVELVLAVHGLQAWHGRLRKWLDILIGRERRVARGWVRQTCEGNRRRRPEDISIPLVVEGVRGVVCRNALDKGDNLAMPAMRGWCEANAVCAGES